VDLTSSYVAALSGDARDRYEIREVRNAAAILRATNPLRFADIEEVISNFWVVTSDFVTPGGQETNLAARLNSAFRERGWREARVDVNIKLALKKMPFRSGGETDSTITETEVTNEGYKVDNMFDRIALDVEWNAKDGNLDRDIAAYRSLYDAGLIDGAVVVTRTLELRELGQQLGLQAGLTPKAAKNILQTTTTTNLKKLMPRLERGDGGGCPILVIAICDRTWDNFAIEPKSVAFKTLEQAEDSLWPIEPASDGPDEPDTQ
jgi:hypothetical protein